MPKVFDVGRCSARRWPQKIWRKVIRGDLKQWKVNKELAEDKIPDVIHKNQSSSCIHGKQILNQIS